MENQEPAQELFLDPGISDECTRASPPLGPSDAIGLSPSLGRESHRGEPYGGGLRDGAEGGGPQSTEKERAECLYPRADGRQSKLENASVGTQPSVPAHKHTYTHTDAGRALAQRSPVPFSSFTQFFFIILFRG